MTESSERDGVNVKVRLEIEVKSSKDITGDEAFNGVALTVLEALAEKAGDFDLNECNVYTAAIFAAGQRLIEIGHGDCLRGVLHHMMLKIMQDALESSFNTHH